eukprot:5159870-Pyramimonas_sp.AAC.1
MRRSAIFISQGGGPVQLQPYFAAPVAVFVSWEEDSTGDGRGRTTSGSIAGYPSGLRVRHVVACLDAHSPIG